MADSHSSSGSLPRWRRGIARQSRRVAIGPSISQIDPARVRWDLLAGFDEGRLDRPSQARGDDCFLARPINPERVRWDLPAGFDEAGARSCRSADPYWALAIAVRNKERAFAFYPLWRHKPPARRSRRWPRIWRAANWSTPPFCVRSAAARSAASVPHRSRFPPIRTRSKKVSAAWEREV